MAKQSLRRIIESKYPNNDAFVEDIQLYVYRIVKIIKRHANTTINEGRQRKLMRLANDVGTQAHQFYFTPSKNITVVYDNQTIEKLKQYLPKK